MFRYDGSDHGFFCDHRASYNPKAAADAWEQVKQLNGYATVQLNRQETSIQTANSLWLMQKNN